MDNDSYAGDSLGLSVETVEKLYAELQMLRALQAEVKASLLPTQPGLYVHPKYEDAGEHTLNNATILKLEATGQWYNVHNFDGNSPIDKARVLEHKKWWGGLVPLRAVPDPE